MSVFIILLLISIDSLLVSISYSANMIKIPIKSIFIICLTNVFILIILYIIGCYFSLVFNEFISNFLSFIFLIILGLYNIFNDYIQGKISNKGKIGKIFKNKLNADFNNSKYLNYREAIYLGIILSIDTIVGGFGIVLKNDTIIFLCIMSFMINSIFINMGKYINKFNIEYDVEKLIGIFIIIIANSYFEV